jgi:hypothetical protein
MNAKRRRELQTPLPTAKEAQERYRLLDEVIRKERPDGFNIHELESALGMYLIGFHFGWKVLYLVHSKRTVKKYEEILGIKVAEVFEEIGPDAQRTNAHRVMQAVSNFWKAVSGEEKPLLDVDKRTMSD